MARRKNKKTDNGNGVTMKQLVSVAEELNELMGWAGTDDEIVTDTDDQEQLTNEIVGAAKELEPADELTNGTSNTLEALGVTLPEPEPEPEKSTGNAKKAPAKKAPAKKAPPKKASDKGPGVIASILEFITENGPITKEDIAKKLAKRFPDRDAESMAKTVNAQIGGKKSPTRMEREKKVTFVIDDGEYSIKKNGGKKKK